MAGLHQYLRSINSVFAGKELVAVASSRNLIRVFLRGDHRALAESFRYPRATFARAAQAYWARWRSIAIPDYSRFMARQAVREAEAQRWLLGPKVPAAEGRLLDLRVKIAAPTAEKGRSLASALERWRSGTLQFKVIPGPGADTFELQAQISFSETSLQRMMNGICADAAKSGAECVDWGAHFEPLHLNL
jgi:hypothetical protein